MKKEFQGVPAHLVTSMVWVDIAETPVAKREALPGLILPGGKLLVDPNAFSSEGAIKVFKNMFNAERVSVHGTWFFVPDDPELRSFNIVPKGK